MSDKKYKTITVDIDEKTLWWLFQEAHKQDITLNQLVNKLLIRYIDELESGRVKVVKNRVRRRTRVG